jgi:arsenate reductase-like glutaredoxin family protein
MLDRWLAAIEWKTLMNTRSTTWRGLADNDKSDMNTDKAKALMLAHPTLIKRPVAETEKHVSVGFSTERYEKFQGK